MSRALAHRSAVDAPQAAGRWAFAGCGYALLVLFAGSNAPSPLYRVYSQRFGFTPLTITFVFSAYMAVIVPSLLVFGPLSDAVGRRRVLVPGLVLAAVGAGLVATACIVAGAGGGPLLAGVLGHYAPWPRTLVFVVVMAALALALVAIARVDGPTSSRRRWQPRRPQIPGPIAGPFVSASAASFLAWSVTGLFLTLVPSYALNLSGSSNLALAGGVVALLFAGSGAAQLRSRAIPARAGQIAGLVGLMAGLILLVGAGEARSLPVLLLATIIAGLGQGLAFVGAMTEVGAMAPADRQAEVMSTFYVLTYIGTGAPVIGVGLVASRTDLLRAVEAFAAVLVVLCLVLVARLLHSPSPGFRPGGSG